MNPCAVALLIPVVFAAPRAQAPDTRVQEPADPTAIDADLQRALASPDSGRPVAASAYVAPFPPVVIRGIVVPRGGAPIAVIDVDGARARVRVGSNVPIGADDHLRVAEIRAGEIVLSRVSTNETRVVR